MPVVCFRQRNSLSPNVQISALESDTVVPTGVLPRVRGHFWKMLRDNRGSGSQDDGDGMGMGVNFAGFRGSGIGHKAHVFFKLIIYLIARKEALMTNI